MASTDPNIEIPGLPTLDKIETPDFDSGKGEAPTLDLRPDPILPGIDKPETQRATKEELLPPSLPVKTPGSEARGEAVEQRKKDLVSEHSQDKRQERLQRIGWDQGWNQKLKQYGAEDVTGKVNNPSLSQVPSPAGGGEGSQEIVLLLGQILQVLQEIKSVSGLG